MKQKTQSELTVNESKQDWVVGSDAKTVLQKDERVNILSGIGTGMVVAQTRGVNAKENAQRIVTAVNNYDETLKALEAIHDYTYGKGINPAAVPDMLEALKVVREEIGIGPAWVLQKVSEAIAKATNSK